jgi:Rrf2 family protein
MTPYGKTAQHAIAAVSRLAQAYARKQRLSSADIAESRGLPKPVIAKVLTVLSQAGLVAGSPGPGGGYLLAKPPGDIRLYDVATLFDRLEDNLTCPFGPTWCGNGPPCPLHDQLDRLRDRIKTFLVANTFAPFTEDIGPGATPAVPGPLPTIALPLLGGAPARPEPSGRPP